MDFGSDVEINVGVDVLLKRGGEIDEEDKPVDTEVCEEKGRFEEVCEKDDVVHNELA